MVYTMDYKYSPLYLFYTTDHKLQENVICSINQLSCSNYTSTPYITSSQMRNLGGSVVIPSYCVCHKCMHVTSQGGCCTRIPADYLVFRY